MTNTTANGTVKKNTDSLSYVALQAIVLIWYFFFAFSVTQWAWDSITNDYTVSIESYVDDSTTADRGLNIHGSVFMANQTIGDGVAHVTIEQLNASRVIQISTSVDEDGIFTLTPGKHPGLKRFNIKDRVVIYADVVTLTGDGELSGQGFSTLNTTKPYSNVARYCIAATVILLVFAFFTGAYREADHRILVSLSYLLIVAALISPSLFFYKGQRFLESIESAPVGIVLVSNYFPNKNKEAGTQTIGNNYFIEMDQWALNIGGWVVKQTPVTSNNQAKPEHDSYSVYGGLVIPVFVLILAIFGGAVRMAQAIPDLQQGFRYKSHLNIADLLLIRKTNTDGQAESQHEQLDEAGETRAKIIRQITYLIASPVVAVAAYYLLQLVDSSLVKNTAVVVIMSFSAGFLTEKALKALAQAGSRILESRPATAAGEVTVTPPQSGSKPMEASRRRQNPKE